jgi:hypothetical protein
VSVPYWEWNKLRKDRPTKQQYLRSLIGIWLLWKVLSTHWWVFHCQTVQGGAFAYAQTILESAWGMNAFRSGMQTIAFPWLETDLDAQILMSRSAIFGLLLGLPLLLSEDIVWDLRMTPPFFFRDPLKMGGLSTHGRIRPCYQHKSWAL